MEPAQFAYRSWTTLSEGVDQLARRVEELRMPRDTLIVSDPPHYDFVHGLYTGNRGDVVSVRQLSDGTRSRKALHDLLHHLQPGTILLQRMSPREYLLEKIGIWRSRGLQALHELAPWYAPRLERTAHAPGESEEVEVLLGFRAENLGCIIASQNEGVLFVSPSESTRLWHRGEYFESAKVYNADLHLKVESVYQGIERKYNGPRYTVSVRRP